MSEEKRFYYLRLMAKPGGKPIKTKFVTWSKDDETSSTSRNDQQLESQAMRVVRTIGQAFEVCHKVAQEQMQEKHEDEAAKSKISMASDDEGVPALDVIEEKGVKEEGSRSTSPMEPPALGGPLYGKRMSLFQPRKMSTGSSSAGTAIDTTVVHVEAQEVANTGNPILQAKATEIVPQLQPQMAVPFSQKQQGMSGLSIPQQYNTMPAQSSYTTAPPQNALPHDQSQRMMQMPNMPYSATLPHSRTWAAPHITQYPQAVQSLDQPLPMFYPLSGMMPSSSSMPFGLSPPVMVSPYATLQLNNMPTALDPNDPNAMTLEQYNQQLMRSQLDQAQQSAQVAGCQVQLLRDQLTSETTARLEAQSRTHQLLSANRELLEQVQNLVQRLQMLETKITSEIQHSTGDSPKAMLPKSSTFDNRDLRVPAGSSVKPNLPYQVQPLADLRAGSLPPAKEVRERKRDEGARTEPESNNDDTTDYSSSDQYEKTSNLRPSHFNILMSNPLADINVPSTTAPIKLQQEFQDDEAQPSVSTSPRRERRGTSGILRGDKDFARMSFNPRRLMRDRDVIEDAVDETPPTPETSRRKPDEDNPPSPLRRDKVTVESLFKPAEADLGEREPVVSPRKNTTFSIAPNTGLPASSSIVTAMYPPIRKQTGSTAKPKIDILRKKTLRTLSVDIGDEPTSSDFNKNVPPRKKEEIEIKDIEDYINRNVDRTKLPETSLLARLTRQGDQPSLGSLPNGYPS
ncbi:unnamed protein product [Caenorhabditis auriculariae]|uniref:PID domain-containing protein n=1 Tax=Caenorhabditis auriculariae TaxID=2777116 RepID=A0A8S1GWQ1_9PELO|nr:unnamed protein product [Caenorhabditis auriculariae]